MYTRADILQYVKAIRETLENINLDENIKITFLFDVKYIKKRINEILTELETTEFDQQKKVGRFDSIEHKKKVIDNFLALIDAYKNKHFPNQPSFYLTKLNRLKKATANLLESSSNPFDEADCKKCIDICEAYEKHLLIDIKRMLDCETIEDSIIEKQLFSYHQVKDTWDVIIPSEAFEAVDEWEDVFEIKNCEEKSNNFKLALEKYYAIKDVHHILNSTHENPKEKLKQCFKKMNEQVKLFTSRRGKTDTFLDVFLNFFMNILSAITGLHQTQGQKVVNEIRAIEGQRKFNA